MFDEKYWDQKKMKLEKKAQGNIQRFISFAFDMVEEANDINERLSEIDKTIVENREKASDKKDEKIKK